MPHIKSGEPLSINVSDSSVGYDKIDFAGTEDEFSEYYKQLNEMGLKVIGVDWEENQKV